MVERRQRQDDAVERRRRYRDGHARRVAGLPGQLHEARRDVAVEVEAAGRVVVGGGRSSSRSVVGVVGVRGGGRGIRAGAAEHGQDDGEGGLVGGGGRGGEGDVQDGRAVDEGVDCGVVVGAWRGVSGIQYRCRWDTSATIIRGGGLV